MTERPALSKSELEVARILWELGAGSVREVRDAFPPDRDPDFATVQTYLRRLETKGYVKSKLVGRIKVYRPRIKPVTVIRDTVNDLVDRLFGGETLPLVRHLIEDRGIGAKEIAELRHLLDDLNDGTDTDTDTAN